MQFSYMDAIKLRPHHLLCIRGFKGKGYSESFVENFREVMRRLEQNPAIEIVDGGDEICKACPHFKNEKCLKSENSEDKVRELDGMVISKLKLSIGMKMSYQEVSNLVEKIPKSELPEICGRCEWIEYCTK
jgi:hypothetical protein